MFPHRPPTAVRALRGLMLLLAGIGLLTSAPPAQAHAFLVQSDPAPGARLETPPRQVRLWFSEPVDPRLSGIEVYDAARRRVDRGDLTADPADPRRLQVTLEPLSEGAYTVVWQAFSRVDGHLTRGFFGFAVGQAAIPTASGVATALPLWAAGAQGVHRIVFLILVGLLLFHEWVFRPAAEAAGPAGAPLARLGARGLLLALAVGWIAEALQAAAQVSALGRDLPPTAQAALLERVGGEALARGAMVGGAAFLTGVAPEAAAGLGLPKVLLALGALAIFSLTSHGAAVGALPVWLADFLHRTAAAFWAGGLFGMAAALGALRALPPEARRMWLAAAVPRFSRLAFLAVFLLALTGLYHAWVEVGTPDRLMGTLYGRLLIAKSSLLLMLLPIAAWNRFRMRPRLAEATAEALRFLPPFRTLVLIEAVGVAAIVALAAGLAGTPPPRVVPAAQAAPPALILLGRPAADVRLRVTLAPADAPRRLEIEVSDPAGNPLPDLQRVIVELTLLDSDIGARRVQAQRQPDGRFRVEEALSLPGFWRIRTIVRRQGREDVASDFPFYRPGGALEAGPSDPQALDLLRRADARMNRLRSVRMEEALNDGDGRALFAVYAFQAPDRMRVQIEGGATATTIGNVQFVEENGKPMTLTLAVPFVFPDFRNAEGVEVARLGRTERLGEIPTQVVVARGRSTGLALAFWIAEADARLLQVMMVGPGHFMVQRYLDFDAPLNIERP